jgi:hypothetical protein|tara:strand:- start:40 stop:264 length:225 start_codon:yes stop_codon:yes gene_type:complete
MSNIGILCGRPENDPRERLWKMPRLMEIREEHGFPQPFGKASQKTLGFTTFSTASTAVSIPTSSVRRSMPICLY